MIHSSLRIVKGARLATSALLVGLVVACSCSEEPSRGHAVPVQSLNREATCNISDFVGALMQESSILFIGDMANGQWQYKNVVIDFLDYWSQAPADSFAVQLKGLRSITLILECDSLQVERAQAYMETWDFAHLADVNRFCSGAATADLEFYWRLGNILHRIARRNHDAGTQDSLSLTLLPGESVVDLSDWTFEKRGAYFVHERDLRIALRISAYHDLHPGSKMLAYYSVAHLKRGRVRKHADRQSDSTFYAVSYLDSLWQGSANICTIAQADRNAWPFAFWEGQPECDFIVPCRKIKDTIIKGEAPTMIQYDALIIQGPDRELHLPLYSVPSLNVARLMISKLPSLLDTANQYHQAAWPTLITYLEAVSGLAPQRFNIHDENDLREACRFWQTWSSDAQIDIVKDIVSLQLWTRLIDSLPSASNQIAQQYDREIMFVLSGAPAFDSRFGLPTNADRADQLRKYLLTNRDQVVIRALINLLWVGSAQEKQSALIALVAETKENFTTPDEWSRWFRSGFKQSWE